MIKQTGESYRKASMLIIDALAQYLDESHGGQVPVVDLKPMAQLANEMDLRRLIREGGLNHTNLQQFINTYLKHSMHMHHPAYIGHQVAVPHVAAALADMVNGLLSNPMSIYEMGPGAAVIEQEMVKWMLEKIGWESEGSGIFTHGGSLANIHAMLAARAAVNPEAWQEGVRQDLVVLTPDNAHYSIARAVSIIGLGSKAIIPIPTDEYETVTTDLLENTILEQKARGKTIMAVVANACATSTGIYDALEPMADICQKHHCWFHVDSPHGATAILSEKYRYLLHGLERADSMIWDAHKMMQTGPLSTAILFKNKKHVFQTFSQKGSYLFYEKENLGVDVLPYQIECTKSTIATRLFFVMAAIGEKGMADFVETLYDRSKIFAEKIRSRPGFACTIPVQSNIILFRYKPELLDQLKLREKLIKTGTFYITSTEVGGIRHLRLVVMHLGTTEDTIDALLDKIEEVGAEKL